MMGGVLGKDNAKPSAAGSKLDLMVVQAMRKRAAQGTRVKSFNSIILKFSRIDESLKNVKTIFEQFDEDSNGAIDPKELKNCFQKLQISATEDEINGLFMSCDISSTNGMKFNEFIVLLCLVYLLKEPPYLPDNSRMGLPHLESTFETLIDAFVFLDKNKDGYVSKSEMVEAVKDKPSSSDRSSGGIAMKRFEEMDWDKNGMVTFKEFLFAFTRWVGIDADDEDEDEE